VIVGDAGAEVARWALLLLIVVAYVSVLVARLRL